MKMCNYLNYAAPDIEVVEIAFECGFEASSDLDSGFNGPSYGEEDVEW